MSQDYDNSSDEDQDYTTTTTNVTLGYASNDADGDEISFIGGHPSWIDPRHTPPASFAKCTVCNDYMSLLLQLNANLSQHFPTDERCLRVVICRRKACARKIGCIKAFREVKKGKSRDGPASEKRADEGAKKKVAIPDTHTTPTQGLGNTLFGGSAPQTHSNNINPFSPNASTAANGPVNPFSSLGSTSVLASKPAQKPDVSDQVSEPPSQSFADRLKLSDQSTDTSYTQSKNTQSHELWPPTESFPTPYPSFYLDAYPEELDAESVPSSSQTPSKATFSKYDTEDTTSDSIIKDDSFESSLDKTFLHFSDRIAQNPSQVLRYEFKGQPLLYNATDAVGSCFVVPHGRTGPVKGIPRCNSCGGSRVFEMQLVPGLIFELEKEDEDAMALDSGMEWGNIIVGVCANNCGRGEEETSFHEEWVGVQWEERNAVKK